MKIRKFQAGTMPEVMEQIRNELGSNAVILQNKVIKKGGFLGLFQQNIVEVVAALDEAPIRPVIPDDFPGKRGALAHEANGLVLNEIKHLQQLIKTGSIRLQDGFPPTYEYANRYLQKQGIEHIYVKEWLSSILESDSNKAFQTKNGLEDLVVQKIKQVLHPRLPVETGELKQVMQFVGPTGVGKTTTIAKIASHTILNENKKIAFITLDTYRIAAIEQIRTYAKILNCPLEVAYSIRDYQKALQKLAHFDHIFVDTPGMNFREPNYIGQLRDMLATGQTDVQTVLVLALTAKDKDMLTVYEQFKVLPIAKMILTKLDETSTYGGIVNLLMEDDIPILYLANGQNVPDDLLKPEINFICQMIMDRYSDE